MDTELHFLRGLLAVAIVIAPWVTSRFFLQSTKIHDRLYLLAAPLTLAALLFDLPALAFAWPVFTLSAAALFLREHAMHLRSPYQFAKGVPLYGEAGSHRMPPSLFNHIRFNRQTNSFSQVHPGNGSTRTGALAIAIKGDRDCRTLEAIFQTRSQQTHDSGMPFIACGNNYRRSRTR